MVFLQKCGISAILCAFATVDRSGGQVSSNSRMPATTSPRIPRPPVVTVMGHIDHGKSSLLDYIRKTKIAEGEVGGITQHLSAYEVEHTHEGMTRRITFLDTPGHEAFQHLRSRGSNAADLAILVVAADDGVKPQTLEALKAIQEAGIPYLVALSKIDKANTDLNRAKSSLVEHGIYIEGMGGDVPYVPISSKTGAGIPELLDLLLLSADMQELQGDATRPAEGLVIESHVDPKSGITASLIIKDGTLHEGEYVVAGGSYAPLRRIEDFLGKRLKLATFSSPITVAGFSEVPPVGSVFVTVADKLAARTLAQSQSIYLNAHSGPPELSLTQESRFVLPVVLKADVVGSLEAVKHEMKKQEDERTSIQFIHSGVGTITEGDVKHAAGSSHALVIGFNVGIDASAAELAERMGLTPVLFRIIYELSDWLPSAITQRRPKVRGEVVLAEAKVLKCFSASKKLQTVGARVLSGTLEVGQHIRIIRGSEILGEGRVDSLQSGKSSSKTVTEGTECGAQIDIALEGQLTHGDEIVAFTIVVQ